MSDITTQRPLELIEAEINFYKAQTVNGIIEIGKRLLEAKEQLQHGQWGKWLEEKVDFSQRTANRFMQAASEFSNSPALTNLGQTKLFALLDIPSEERQDFIQQNNVEEMSSRQVDAAVKEWKAKAEKAEADLQSAKQTIQDKKDDIKLLQEMMRDEKAAKEEQIQKLTEELAKAKATESNSRNVEELQEELDEAKRQVEILTDELMKPGEIQTAVVKEVPEEVQMELDELRKFKETANHEKPAVPTGTATVKFKVYFDGLVKGFNDLLETLKEIQQAEPETYSKYSKATDTLITKMREQL